MGLRSILARFVDDCRELWRWLVGRAEPEISLAEMVRATIQTVTAADVDWFVWECEQYAKSPVFWHDHWRYEGTEWAYPEPTDVQRGTVWLASLRRAINEHGEAAVRLRGHIMAAVLEGTTAQGDHSLADEYWRQPDPWAWAMSQRVH